MILWRGDYWPGSRLALPIPPLRVSIDVAGRKGESVCFTTQGAREGKNVPVHTRDPCRAVLPALDGSSRGHDGSSGTGRAHQAGGPTPFPIRWTIGVVAASRPIRSARLLPTSAIRDSADRWG